MNSCESCPDNEALPKGGVRTVRERQPLLALNGVGARLNGMNNICEPLINVVTSNELLTMLGSNPKGTQSVNLLHAKVTRT